MRTTSKTFRTSLITCALGLVATACGSDRDDGDLFDSASGDGGSASGVTAGDASASGDGGSASASGGDGSGDDGSGDGGSAGDDGGVIYDVGDSGGGTDTAGGCADPDGECGCDAVDMLFVVDNSVSMGDYQNAIAVAFPQFADVLVNTLEPGTSLRVGVTSTTMGYSSSGATSNCSATGDNGQPQDFFYQTADMGNNGLNGAQGRLYVPNGQTPFYEVETDAGAGAIQGLKDWFAEAARVGESGSQVEMASAAAGWVGDAANQGNNVNFIRDEGAVLVVFFLQDEADQTPWTIDGMPGGTAMLNKLAESKAGCGGTNCIIGGGFVNTSCMPMVALGEFFAGMGAPAEVAPLPDENLAEDFPDQAAAEMNQLLGETLANVIGQKCEEIPPVG